MQFQKGFLPADAMDEVDAQKESSRQSKQQGDDNGHVCARRIRVELRQLRHVQDVGNPPALLRAK
jgi:hypothetical protein